MITDGPWVWELVEQEGCIPEYTLRGPDVLCRYWDTGVTGRRDSQALATVPEMVAVLEGLLSVFGTRNHKMIRRAQVVLARVKGETV